MLQTDSQGSRLWAIGRGVGWVKTRVPLPIYRGIRLGWHNFCGAVDHLGLRRLAWRWRLSTEIAHWDQWMRTRGLDDPDDYARRIMPDRPLQENLRRLLPAQPQGTAFRVLDVGAGPLTTVGKVCDGRKLDLVCIDPLAQVYDTMLAANGISPPVRTKYGEAEQIGELFAENSFDLVHAFNSLDHAHDPIKAIRSAVRIVKPGGFVYLWHWLNEGEREHYGGLHQWNFGTSGDAFTITSNDGRTTNLTNDLQGVADVTCQVENGRWLTVHIQKQPIQSRK